MRCCARRLTRTRYSPAGASGAGELRLQRRAPVRAGDDRVAARRAQPPRPAQRELFVAFDRVVAQQRRDRRAARVDDRHRGVVGLCQAEGDALLFDVAGRSRREARRELEQLHRRRRVLEVLRQEERDEARDHQEREHDTWPARSVTGRSRLVNRPRPISSRPARSVRPCPSASPGAGSPARARRRRRCCRGCIPCRSA